ncbi:hypothetical protein [Actinomadura rugatobispora]|uniref:DUF2203 family protein n=1 Tax=Actinomadura rugatobispora TaxID=1994 RepID=A0ABW1ABL4_9ACTN|nr:hypothetical protein GCM10010200_005480 [Actinomadura rugatobispora]
MGVSIYYSAYRDSGLTDEERRLVEDIADEETRELLAEIRKRLPAWKERGAVPGDVESPGEICEGLPVFPADDSDDPRELFWGSSKISHGECEMEVMTMQLEHYTQFSLGRLRQAVPGAEWHVHIDGTELTWEEEYGEYALH